MVKYYDSGSKQIQQNNNPALGQYMYSTAPAPSTPVFGPVAAIVLGLIAYYFITQK